MRITLITVKSYFSDEGFDFCVINMGKEESVNPMNDDITSLSGKFLIAMPGMGDMRFEKTVIYICAHSDEGAMGFIINQTIDQPRIGDFLQQLDIIRQDEVETLPKEVSEINMHTGGPVEPGRGFVLHTPDFKSASTVEVAGNVCLTATLEILRAIAIGKGPKHHMIALGYSGWSSGQLEDEMLSNGWLTVDADETIIFDTNNRNKYSRSLKLLGVDEALLSSSAGSA